MNMHSLAVTIDHLTALDPTAAGLLELAARGTLILAFAFLFGALARSFPAAWRHLIWHGCFTALLLLPLFMALPPLLEIPLAPHTGADSATAVSGPLAAVLAGEAWRRWLLPLWLLPACVLMLYTLLGLLRATLLTRASRPAAGGAMAMLAALQAEAGDDRRVALRVHAGLRAPVSWGLLRPVILLPQQACDWPEDQLRHVLLHELAHIGRLDWLGQLLARLACALYWYNPLAWLAARRLAEEAECACDDAVLLHGQAGGDYADALLAVARGAGEGRRALIVQAMADSFLGRRLAAILDPRVRRDASEGLHLVRGLLACLPLLAAVATVELVPGKALPAVQLSLGRLVPVNLLPAPAPVRPDMAKWQGSQLPERPGEVAVPPPLRGVESDLPSPRADEDRHSLPLMEIRRDFAPLVIPRIEAASSARALTPLNHPLPAYPASALQRGLEGFTVVEYDVTAAGEVGRAAVIESQPGAVFDQASLEAVRAYRYTPQMVGGAAVAVRGLRTRFVYRLRPAPD